MDFAIRQDGEAVTPTWLGKAKLHTHTHTQVKAAPEYTISITLGEMNDVIQ